MYIDDLNNDWDTAIIDTVYLIREKRKKFDYDKSPYTNRNVKRQSDNTIKATNSSITQRLRTDLGRSVGVTTATNLVWST